MTNLKDKLKGFLELKLIDEIIAVGNVMTFKEGDVIMDYGKKIKFMPLILSGTIRVLRKDEEDREILRESGQQSRIPEGREGIRK